MPRKSRQKFVVFRILLLAMSIVICSIRNKYLRALWLKLSWMFRIANHLHIMLPTFEA